MHKLLPVLVLIAAELTPGHGSGAADLRFNADTPGAGNAAVLVGGMGQGTGGGMGGMTGGGMGGMTGGGMGGMTGGGIGGVFGGMNPYGGGQGNSLGRAFGGSDPSGEAAQPAQYYLCVTPYG